MQEKKTSVFSNGLIWFGAAVSIAEILTGTLIAPLGMFKGTLAVILGHVIGCVLLCLCGVIGGKTGLSSMESVRLSFGKRGSLVFSALNVLQLVGWTAVMLVSGAAAAESALSAGSVKLWTVIIAALILVWVLVGFKTLNKINTVAMSALFVLTIILTVVIFRGESTPALPSGELSFGAAVELSVAMPLSWLPLIADYTRSAQKPVKASVVSSAVYFAVSSFMYFIGMSASLYTGESDIAKIMAGAGFGLAGLVIVVFSTVTTTFLDVYSAGVSTVSITSRIKEKPAAAAVCVIGTLLALFTPVSEFENFLYLIGSVFAPMTAILVTDYFILKNDFSAKSFGVKNLIIWVLGFILYRVFMRIDTPVGNTLPVMIIISAVTIITNYAGGKINERKNQKSV